MKTKTKIKICKAITFAGAVMIYGIIGGIEHGNCEFKKGMIIILISAVISAAAFYKSGVWKR